MLKGIKWFGTVASVIGAFVLATHFFIIGYIIFVFGSSAWLYAGIREKDKALISLNIFFLAADFVGIYNAI